jgi:hypothetical protein
MDRAERYVLLRQGGPDRSKRTRPLCCLPSPGRVIVGVRNMCADEGARVPSSRRRKFDRRSAATGRK